MYVLVMRAYAYLAGHEVALLTITTPLFVVLAGALLSRTRHPPRGARVPGVQRRSPWLRPTPCGAWRSPCLGSEAAFWTGVALVQGGEPLLGRGPGPLRPDRVLLGRRIPARFGWLYVGGALLACALAARPGGPGQLNLDRGQVLTLLYLGLVPSGVAFFLWNRGAIQVGIGTLAVMNNLKVPLAVAVALAPPFNEAADLTRLLAGAALPDRSTLGRPHARSASVRRPFDRAPTEREHEPEAEEERAAPEPVPGHRDAGGSGARPGHEQHQTCGAQADPEQAPEVRGRALAGRAAAASASAAAISATPARRHQRRGPRTRGAISASEPGARISASPRHRRRGGPLQ